MVQPGARAGNPANNTELAGAIQFAYHKFLQNTDDMLPAKVLSYDRTTNRAKLQIMVPMVTTQNEVQQRAIVASVPVLQLGGGGFVISFPIAVGDIGWIKATDRDISMFKKTYSSSSGPPTQRLHSFEDAMFIPDTMLQGVTIAEEDEPNLVIQTYAGDVKISWWAQFLKVIGRVGLGINPDANTIFHIHSTTQASIPWPRMTLVQRNAIPDPIDGMAVWITDVSNHGLSVYNDITDTWS
jgi:hypothetical protein